MGLELIQFSSWIVRGRVLIRWNTTWTHRGDKEPKSR